MADCTCCPSCGFTGDKDQRVIVSYQQKSEAICWECFDILDTIEEISYLLRVSKMEEHENY